MKNLLILFILCMCYACETGMDLDKVAENTPEQPIATKSTGIGLSAAMTSCLEVQWDHPFQTEGVSTISARNTKTGVSSSLPVSSTYGSCSFPSLIGYGTYRITATCTCRNHTEEITYIYNEKGFNLVPSKICNHQYEYSQCASLTEPSASRPSMRLSGTSASFRFWIGCDMILSIHQINDPNDKNPSPSRYYGGISSAPGTYTETPYFSLPPTSSRFYGDPEYEVRLYAYTYGCFSHPQYPQPNGDLCTHYYKATFKASDYEDNGYYKTISFQEVKRW